MGKLPGIEKETTSFSVETDSSIDLKLNPLSEDLMEFLRSTYELNEIFIELMKSYSLSVAAARSMNKHELLTKDQELNAILRLRFYSALLANDRTHGEIILSDEERAQAQELSDELWKILICANQRLIFSVMKDLTDWLDPMDLMQHGVLGLMRAIETFSYAKSSRLSTHAKNWIRQARQVVIAENFEGGAIGRHTHSRIRKAAKADEALREEQPELTETERVTILAERFRYKKETVKGYLLAAVPKEELSRELPDRVTQKSDMIADESASVEMSDDDLFHTLDSELVTTLITALSDSPASQYSPVRLSKAEKLVLRLQFGFPLDEYSSPLEDGFSHTFEEIEEITGLPPRRVRHYREHAMGKLRRYAAAKTREQKISDQW